MACPQHVVAVLTAAMLAFGVSAQLVQQALVAENPGSSDFLGTSVAFSRSTVIAGAPSKTVSHAQPKQGAAYVFDCSASECVQGSELLASDGAAFDDFGTSVAASGNIVVVGAEHHTVGNNEAQGAVYVFLCLTASTCAQTAVLAASDGATYDFFGIVTAMSGGTLVVGAPYKTVGSNSGQGGVYVFDCAIASSCVQASFLTATDGTENAFVGSSVAIDGHVVVVGAPQADGVAYVSAQGAAYVFSCLSPFNCIQASDLVASDGEPLDYFGQAVAVSGGMVVVGAPNKDGFRGAAYVFTCITPSTCTQTFKLLASDAAAFDAFSSSLAASNAFVYVGAPTKSAGGHTSVGAVYVFDCRSPLTCTQMAELTAADAHQADRFGYALAASDQMIVSGAPFKTLNASITNQGSVYVFRCPSANDYGLSCLSCSTACAHGFCAPGLDGYCITTPVCYIGDDNKVHVSNIPVGTKCAEYTANYNNHGFPIGNKIDFSLQTAANATSVEFYSDHACTHYIPSSEIVCTRNLPTPPPPPTVVPTAGPTSTAPTCYIGADSKVHVQHVPSFVQCAEYTANYNDRGIPVNGRIDFSRATNVPQTAVDFYFDEACTQYVASSEIECRRQ